MQKRTRINQNKVIELLRINGGDIKLACKQAEVGRTQYYEWIKRYPSFKSRVQEIEFQILRYTKSSLFKQVIEGDRNAMNVLKRKMERRLSN